MGQDGQLRRHRHAAGGDPLRRRSARGDGGGVRGRPPHLHGGDPWLRRLGDAHPQRGAARSECRGVAVGRRPAAVRRRGDRPHRGVPGDRPHGHQRGGADRVPGRHQPRPRRRARQGGGVQHRALRRAARHPARHRHPDRGRPGAADAQDQGEHQRAPHPDARGEQRGGRGLVRVQQHARVLAGRHQHHVDQHPG